MRTLSERTEHLAEAAWRAARPAYGPLAEQIDRRLADLAGDERTLMTLAYGTLPLGDGAGTPFDTLAAFARHGLAVRRSIPWCRALPEEMFLHFVWYPRVNDESLADCRELFRRQIWPRVAELPLPKAALEVNRWCAEYMTYRLTDERTMSPLTAWRTGTGRCGEESVMCVTALRSVGIAARQVYVPWWAHCDDNHAWVEFWDGGRWRFMGACEPEPEPDRGWFRAAAARAPLVRYRTFFDCEEDPPAGRIGPARLYSVTARYAPVRPVTVRVTDEAGQPAAGARVELSVVNMAAFRPVLWGRADESGVLTADVGRCALHAEAALDGRLAAGDIPAGEGPAELTLAWGDGLGRHEGTFAPAPPCPPDETPLFDGQRAERARVRERCGRLRRVREESWARPEYAQAGPPWDRLFRLAAGNAPELYRFYAAHPGAERTLAAGMLEAMGEKDLRDVTFSVLEDHLRRALPFAGGEHFTREVLCPRIGLEPPESWRSTIGSALPPETLDLFARRPEEAAAYVRRNLAPAPERTYPPAAMAVSAALACGHGDERAAASLTVAMLRCAGVPARLNPAEGRAEYWRGGAYHSLTGPDGSGTIRLEPAGPSPWVRGRDWTLSRREADGWRVLALEDLTGPTELAAAPGLWRLTVCRRLADGSQQVRTDTFRLADGECHTAALVMPAEEETAVRIGLPPLVLTALSGEAAPLEALLPEGGLLLRLRPGEEPTEHVLGELAEAGRSGEPLPDLALVLDGPGGEAALAERLGAYRLHIAYDRYGAGEELARALFLAPEAMPLTAALDRGLLARYADGGYRAGGTALALGLWRRLCR